MSVMIMVLAYKYLSHELRKSIPMADPEPGCKEEYMAKKLPDIISVKRKSENSIHKQVRSIKIWFVQPCCIDF